jgi:DNA uptake protein ComE-like DNA-binding protein
MKKSILPLRFMVYGLIFLFLLPSCITYRFIRNEDTVKMEKGLQGERTGSVIGNSFLMAFFGFLSVITNTDLVNVFLPEQKLRHLTLADTLQVNMLAGQARKDSQYCDFKDIRIPPGEKCRLLVPVNCNYNLYFSNTINTEEDDELLEINTNSNPKIKLYPGMTNKSDSISIH